MKSEEYIKKAYLNACDRFAGYEICQAANKDFRGQLLYMCETLGSILDIDSKDTYAYIKSLINDMHRRNYKNVYPEKK